MSENRQRSSNNPYRTVSASERRARRRAREGTPASQVKTPTEKAAVLPQEMIEELLHNPTKVVTEEQLRGEYSYVVADIRNMGILAAGLVVLLIALATFLPR
jgi:hypothetical protein